MKSPAITKARVASSAIGIAAGALLIFGVWYRWIEPRDTGVLPEVASGTTALALGDTEAKRVMELAGAMRNPAESVQAAAELRAHIEQLIQQQSNLAPLSMVLFLECLGPRFASLDSGARQISLAMLADILGWFDENATDCWAALLAPSGAVLEAALADRSPDVVLAALGIVRASWNWSPPEVEAPAQRKALGMWKAKLHEKCVGLLGHRDDRVRLAAGVAVVAVPIHVAAEKGLHLLHDSSPVVRCSLLLALSDRSDLLASDDVVPFLSDPDSKVRSTADLVLSSRGLSREQIALASRATNPSALVRAQAPRHILESTAVDRVVWLQHLSRDEAGAVRSEAARAWAAIGGDDCRARLEEMAESDPDSEVRRLAGELAERMAAPSADAPDTPQLPRKPSSSRAN